MARVFISYRRADGPYAVGWIAERLAQMDEVGEVRTAFQDGNLRWGDDFPTALKNELKSCHVLIAVIGPDWNLERLRDPSDWVGKEISTALDMDTPVLPVLIGGAEPPGADQLRSDLVPLSTANARPFADKSDLDELVEHLRSHLEEIDAKRSQRCGLRERFIIEPIRPRWWTIGLALAAAVLGGLIGWGITRAFVGSGDQVRQFERQDELWIGPVVAEVALWSAFAVLGPFYFWRALSETVIVQWRQVLVSFAAVAGVLALANMAFGVAPPVGFGEARPAFLVVLAVGLLSPWILMMFTSAWTTPVAKRDEFGRRARTIARMAAASRTAAAVLGLAAAPAVVAAIGLDAAVEDMDDLSGPSTTGGQLVVYALFLAVLVGAAVTWSLVQLRAQSSELKNDMDVEKLPRESQGYAEEHLIERVAPFRPWWLLVALVSPLVAVALALPLYG